MCGKIFAGEHWFLFLFSHSNKIGLPRVKINIKIVIKFLYNIDSKISVFKIKKILNTTYIQIISKLIELIQNLSHFL